MKPVRTFTVKPFLPATLERHHDLVYNLRWAWNHDAIELFRWDREQWEKSGHNPVLMLGKLEQSKLHDAASDEGFLAHLSRVASDLDSYLKSESTWFYRQHGRVDHPLIAYFSAEFGITDCLSIFAGGLGILAGDHLKSASDLGLPLVGVGLLYQQGYFRQHINEAGWQQEEYVDNDFHNLPLTLERGRDGEPLMIDVPYPGRSVAAQIWRAQVGRIALYLLDTNIPQNTFSQNGMRDQDITDQLYGGDTEMRIQQDIMLGIGGYRALEALGIQPSIYHLNEGHPAFLALEYIRRLMETHRCSFAEAREAASAGLVFTTHTPVPAGHDNFSPELMARYFKQYADGLGLSFDDLMALGTGASGLTGNGNLFCMTVLLLRLAQSSNGVSQLHGQVTRRMWGSLWPGAPEDEIPIGHVTNGVHFQSWISQEMEEVYDRHLGVRWREEPADETHWSRVHRISPEELWRTHERRRERLINFVRYRLRAQLERRGAPQAEMQAANQVFNPDVMTIGFARRFATYKRATLLLRDPDRLARILNDPVRPVQIIFAGQAHPRDEAGKEMVKQVVVLTRQPEFRNRLIFLEGYDMALARSMVQGVDVWLSTPRRPLEASGTSGMKAAANGAINLSTLDGWWDEAWDCAFQIPDSGIGEGKPSWPAEELDDLDFDRATTGSSQSTIGWAIGRREVNNDPDLQDEVEAEALYHLLESEVIPTFYDRSEDKLPRRWIALMKTSIGSLCHFFNTHRMVREYTERFYLPAAARHEQLNADGLARARSLAAWKERLRQQWPFVRVTSVSPEALTELQVNNEIKVQVLVELGALTPEEISVELCLGLVNANDEIIEAQTTPMIATGEKRDAACLFEAGSVRLIRSGLQGFTVRVLPRHPDLVTPFLPGLIVWAGDFRPTDERR